MNALVLLLLLACGGNGFGGRCGGSCDCDNARESDCIQPRVRERDRDCDCDRNRDRDRDCDRDRDRDRTFPTFPGSSTCGCEEA